MYQDIIIETNNNVVMTNVYSIRKSLMCISSVYIFFYFLYYLSSYFIEDKQNRMSQIISSVFYIYMNFIGLYGYKSYNICLVKCYNIYLLIELFSKLIICFFYVQNLLVLILLLLSIFTNIWILKLSYKYIKNVNALNYEDMISLKNNWRPTIYNVIYI